MRRVLSLSTLGLLFGACFFAFSLTPSLIPRTDVVQGAISGFSLAAGYGVGCFLSWLWSALELPVPAGKLRQRLHWVAVAICLLLLLGFLWQATGWQNSVRSQMGMEPVSGVRPVTIALIAVLVFLVVLGLARLFRRTFRFLAASLEERVPRRLSILFGLLAAVTVFWAITDDVVLSAALRATDATYRKLDARMEPDLPAPKQSWKPGGPGSLVEWQTMGHQGRRYLALGPTADEIAEVSGEAQEPIRVYVGLNAAETPEERAALALEELKRVGGFDRSVLVLITPTGTGWVDPGGINSVEFLHRGDIASVAAQYSYLPSPIALMTEGAYGVETARALFREVYGYWRQLPRDARPRLYLFGLSLGALNSDRSFDLYDIIDNPFQGALWTGPPFRSDTWRDVTRNRDPGSPAWLPLFRDGAVIRFGNQRGGYERGSVPWGSFRIAYLQHASDPIVFFEPEAALRKPAWMGKPRGPDVSPDLQWYPIVTMLQLAADMHAGIAPEGFGHSYAPADYLDAWLALTEPEGWTEEELDRVREKLAQRNPR
ncbi:alpha/beta hydrolase [Microbulbifer guangxiensis]|uniref:alpha/beta hydrolase n=1 Tax=Microbulbifer guangxiensis TaxID=2904249 RepID=UPI001F158297|nr:alpha/beta-hydrolase family protein [Microbulbifer guangxiensis]